MSYDFAGSPRYQSPMTDLSPERLEKLLGEIRWAEWRIEGPRCVQDLFHLSPDLARQRIADAKRIAELEAIIRQVHFECCGLATVGPPSVSTMSRVDAALKDSQ